MRAGLLYEPITILQSQITRNEYGEETTVWVNKYETKARLLHLNGNRVNENDEIVHNYMKSFEVRYYVPVDDYDRVRWNGKDYRVIDIEPNKEQMKQTIRVELIND